MSRPPVDVVVPFRGSLTEREALVARLTRLPHRPDDTITLVENTPGRGGPDDATGDAAGGPVRIHRAPGRHTPGYARNRGAAGGHAEWIVFLDADTDPQPDLLDRYFDPPPAPDTGLLAGGVLDAPVPADGPPPARYAYLQAATSQRQTFRLGVWAFAQTANLACRRAAFAAVGGFRDDVRAGEDADLGYRLRHAGWSVERREAARVVHRNRPTVRGFVVQKALHGAGAAWLETRYPGSFPARRRPGLVWWAARHAVAGLLAAARHRDRDAALRAIFDPLEQLAYEFGRSLPNRRR